MSCLCKSSFFMSSLGITIHTTMAIALTSFKKSLHCLLTVEVLLLLLFLKAVLVLNVLLCKRLKELEDTVPLGRQ